ncbi:phosphoenolpyruvate carboxylase [Siccirubricoccus phaeus]|uniref:phosphoenolpyruvate carboxylase n=1 Tax=Siccirubricoccus phaeus TaxID=2595053 RepID=UPI001A9C8B9C|nr:phosphoenolpyruvate carboxylase [Siccirubricoccus phaeus]
MPDSAPDPLEELLLRLREARDAAAQDPFGDPVLLIALAISRRLDDGTLDLPRVEEMVQRLADSAAADRARRLARYVSLEQGVPSLDALAARLVRPDPDDSPIPFARYRALVEQPRFAAVFTAHPTFSLPYATAVALAEAASGAPLPPGLAHRPPAPTLEEEFRQANAAIRRGRDALDGLSAALLRAAQGVWPDRWARLVPRPVLLSTWVGYDTDGRTDIGWWDTLRLRLVMKKLQLERLAGQVAPLGECATPLLLRVEGAVAAVAAQIEAVPEAPEPVKVQRLAALMVGEKAAALTSVEPLLTLFEQAIAKAPDDAARLTLAVARAGLVAHGLALAHTHMRLNAAQVHNAARQRLGLTISAEDMAQRRGLLAAINAALAEVEAQKVDYGALLGEPASAVRLMLTCAQITKHVDGDTPIRFLIAETETGYTLLAALWLARRFGVDHAVELSPLFETAEALDRGERVLEEALRSPHYRDYLRKHGRICLQFGYSDSGRYVGQLAGSYLAERLKLRLVELLRRHKLDGIEVVLFDTHGESVGRGGHPDSLADRLAYLSPPLARAALDKAGLKLREETAFQGGDGYLLFGTLKLAEATIAGIACHAFTPPGEGDDPVYAEADYVADFFATVRREMQALVADPGYAALLGAFGPGLLDRTGSRPAVRQSDGMGGAVRISHPSQLRAIPNNAILQQLGWMANSMHGLGVAASANPDAFADLRARSPRFARAMRLAQRAVACSDLGVLRAVVDTLDPGPWLDRAGFTRRPGRREELLAVADAVEKLDLDALVRRLFRRLQADHLALKAAWPDLPVMNDRLVLLHALRLALIHRIWLLAAAIPDFSPRHGATREALVLRLLQLDVEPALKLLAEVFPAAPGEVLGLDFHEPPAPREGLSYAAEHAALFGPMGRLFGLVRGCGAAITHEVGAFG